MASKMNIRVYRRDRMLESRVSPMLATLAYRPTEAAAPTAAAKRGPEFDSQSCCRPSKRAKSEAPSCRHTCMDCKCKGFPECYTTMENGETECCMRCRDGGSGEHREWNAKAQQWETVYESDDESDDETDEEDTDESYANWKEMECRRVYGADEKDTLRVDAQQLEEARRVYGAYEKEWKEARRVVAKEIMEGLKAALRKPFVPKERLMTAAEAAKFDAEIEEFDREIPVTEPVRRAPSQVIPVTEPVRRAPSQVIVVPDDDPEVIVVPDDDKEVIVVPDDDNEVIVVE